MNEEYEQIEGYYQNKGREIAKVLTTTYDPADFETDSRRIEAEIYDLATSYAKIFFFEAGSFLSEKNRKDARSQVRSRFSTADQKLDGMNDVDLIAHMIKSEVIRALESEDIFALS
ncbi:MAG: hypothetical protein P4M11_05645 [Candidatus Pacebacteria bacterium]|nr:hypothetical protein [Candidatus Paceibacterota bacterium]